MCLLELVLLRVNARTEDGGTTLLRACKHARVYSREHAEWKVEVVLLRGLLSGGGDWTSARGHSLSLFPEGLLQLYR